MSALKVAPVEVVTDAAAVYPGVLDELVPAAWHYVERWANNPIEADHGRLKHRLRPMRGLVSDRSAKLLIAGHAFVQSAAALRARPRRPARTAGRRGVHRARATDLTGRLIEGPRVHGPANAMAPVTFLIVPS